MARQLLERVNAERALRGLNPLVWHDGLAAMAKDWSQTMSRTGQFVHRPDGNRSAFSVPPVCCWENIFWVQGTMSTAQIHNGWMRSQGHRDNILSPEVTHFGAGIVCGPGGKYATQNFATDAWKGLGTPSTPQQPVAPPTGPALSC
jgi:uncharacterized protein YkwD